MLKGSGWKKGQACAHSWLKNHPLGFIGRGKILTQALWPGMEARLRGSDGKLNAPSTQAVDADGFYVGRDGLPKRATLNRLRFGRDGALIEGAYTADYDSDLSDHSLTGSGGPVAPIRNLNTGNVTDPLGGNAATELIYPAVSGTDALSVAFVNYGTDRAIGWSVWLRGASGGEVVYLMLQGFGADFTLPVVTCTLTTSWQRFTIGDASKVLPELGVDLRFSTAAAQGAQTIYAWGFCIQDQFAFGTGTVDGDDPITVSKDDLRYDNTSEAIIKAAQGTVIIATTPGFNVADLVADAQIFDSRTNPNTDGITLWASPSQDAYGFLTRGNSVNLTLIYAGTPTKGVKAILAHSWKLDEDRAYIDGIQVGEDLSGISPTTQGVVNIGQSFNQNLPGFFKLAKLIITEPVLSTRQVENATAVLRRSA